MVEKLIETPDIKLIMKLKLSKIAEFDYAELLDKAFQKPGETEIEFDPPDPEPVGIRILAGKERETEIINDI